MSSSTSQILRKGAILLTHARIFCILIVGIRILEHSLTLEKGCIYTLKASIARDSFEHSSIIAMVENSHLKVTLAVIHMRQM